MSQLFSKKTSTKSKSKKSSQSSQIRHHKVHFYRQIAFAFIGAALVVICGLVYFSLSQAIIVVNPNSQEVMADFNIVIDTNDNQTDENIEAQLVYVDVEAIKEADSELVEDGEDQPATGTVILKNTSGSDQPLIATTRLLSEDDILFRLTDGVTVPARGEIEAEVYADEAGVAGEIGPSRFTIPGLNQARQQQVFAISEEDMTGGTKAVYKVTQKLIDRLEEEARAVLIQEAKDQLAQDQEELDLDLILDQAVYIQETEKLVEPEVGGSARRAKVTIKATVAFALTNEDILYDLAQQKLFDTDSIGYELSSSDKGSFSYELVNFDAEKETAQIRISLKGTRKINSNYPILDRSELVGLSIEEAKSKLEADPAIETVDITLTPFYQTRIPRLVDHIFIQFN